MAQKLKSIARAGAQLIDIAVVVLIFSALT